MPETTATSDISGSTKVARIASAATTNATLVKNAQGNVYGLIVIATGTPAASTFYLKLYDKATAPVVGTDTPLFTVPIISTTTIPGFVQISIDTGIPFKNGIAYAITTGVADSDTGALGAANLVHGVLLFK